MNEEKRFDDWMERKERLHFADRILPIKEGEIWWVATGENVGVEINGKNEQFSRPVIIFKKLSRFGFLAVPLTSKEHIGTWYTSFIFQSKMQYAALAQIRVMSTARLYTRIGEISKADFGMIKNGLMQLYFE